MLQKATYQMPGVSVTGKKLFIGSWIMRCKNCSSLRKGVFRMSKKYMTDEDWRDSFSERLPGEPDRF